MNYIGSFTEKAVDNFRITNKLVNKELIYDLVKVKKACIYANYYLKNINKNKYWAINKACDEFLKGKFDSSIVVQNIQAGGSTPTNMNVNEILSIRANEIIKNKKLLINPNNDVNMSQSSNDVVPTAAIILTYKKIILLSTKLNDVILSLDNLKNKYGNIVKVGRTHLEDAVPITFKQIFDTYSKILETNLNRLKKIQNEFLYVPLGGTAIGTGITTPKNYSKVVIKKLSEIINLKLKGDVNSSIHIQSNSQFVFLSSLLNVISSDLIRICENLILMNSGPLTGLSEISLPEVEPGSSIMAGKVNPSICEAVIMACMNIEANNNLITIANQSSHLELNKYNPIIYDKVFESLDFLTNSLDVLKKKALDDLIVNEKRCHYLIEHSLVFATILNPYLGYQVVEKIVESSLKEHKTLKQKIEELNFITKEELDNILEVKNLLKSNNIDFDLKKRIELNENYLKFCNKI